MEANRTLLVMFVISLIGVVITIGVGALVLAEFNDSLETDGNTTTIDNPASHVFDDGVNALENFTTQLGTIGTIGGILLLVVLVSLAGIGAYAYGRNKGMF